MFDDLEDETRFDSPLAEGFYEHIDSADAVIGDSLFTPVLWRFNDDLVIVREDNYGFVDAKRYESLEALDAKWEEAIGWVESDMPSEAEMAFLESALTEMCSAMGIEIEDEE